MAKTNQLPIAISWPHPLIEGRLLRRYKRFFVDIQLENGSIIIAHCVNTGRMEGIIQPGLRVWVSPATNPARKLKYTWELAEVEGQKIGTNTSLPNRIVQHLLQQRALPWLRSWNQITAEKTYGDGCRVDFWLKNQHSELYLEVKNCHLRYPDRRAYFPDSVSQRATHHLQALISVVGAKTKAQVLFFCQVADLKAVRPSDLHDPVFAKAARAAHKAGVEFSGLEVWVDEQQILVKRRIPVDLKPYSLKNLLKWKATNMEANAKNLG